jgi:hypothetical protein
MATSTGEVEKINIRSPFYLTVDSEGAPPAYTPPATLTQPLGCGEQINIGEDVGTRIYEVDMTNRSGTFTINYTIYRPVKITTQVTGESAVNQGYLGGDDHAQELIDAGVPSSELTGLTSGAFAQGGIAINRSTDTAATLTITVEAPLATDEYQLSMSCPDETAAPSSTFSLPATPPTNTDLLEDSQTLAVVFNNQYPSSPPVSPTMKVYINGSLVRTLSSSEFAFEDKSETTSIVFSSVSGLAWASNVQSYNKSPYVISDSTFISGDNTIGINLEWNLTDWNTYLHVGLIEFIRTGIFRNTTDNEYQFAYPYYQDTFSYYGGTSIYTTEVRLIGGDNFLFSQGVEYSFIYNTTTRTVSNSTDTNRLTVTQQSHATGGIKV